MLAAAVTLYLRQTYSRFSDYGVKHLKVVPFFGNVMKVFLRLEHFSEDLTKHYRNFSEERYIGRYEFLNPSILVRDLDLVKKITIKDFEYFLDHRGFTDEVIDPLFGRNIFSLKGQEWKDMRSTLSPAFTSSKIKLMVPFMNEAGEQMIQTLKNKIKISGGCLDVECKELTSRYTNDVIASCAFGLKVNSHIDDKNIFYEMGKSVSTFRLRQMMLFFAVSACPSIVRKLKLTLFPKRAKDFFVDIVQRTMKDREDQNIIRPDIIHLLMEAKKGKLSHDDTASHERDTGFATVEESLVGKKTTNRKWSDIDLIAQAVLFFIAGFEPISTTMSFALLELAKHTEVQEQLVKEIKGHHAKNGGKINFNSIQTMAYLDMVISEVLRLWPPAVGTERVCVKSYNLGKPNNKAEKDFFIRKGENIWLPIWCFHRDPNYFPNPEKFDPERFSEKNRHKINTMAYMPFGLGPRNCIGSRFALCELKVLLYQILLHFEVSPSDKTVFNGKLDNDSLNPIHKNGYWLKFKCR